MDLYSVPFSLMSGTGPPGGNIRGFSFWLKKCVFWPLYITFKNQYNKYIGTTTYDHVCFNLRNQYEPIN